ncbi:ATP-binding protein [Shewanella glacialipiscicola]|uniref:IstB-like ATP-binding domain-containing protein n=1 Tax=Shewanella glacialipiscicola TaxID=614069 RepID=A0ABQ6J0I8_9GAMM|nr:hypothetical protein TUM4636_15320 [Shewanella glacialipiscicola]GMA81627.1 hypothetical protein GCM10025855_11600 [Shewanella glacialipiscicola]
MNHLNEQLRTLRLGHAAQALEQQREQLSTYAELSFEERLGLLLEYELLNRDQTKIQRLKRQAKLRLNAQASQLIYKEGRGLMRAKMSELLTGSYLHKHQNILITGQREPERLMSPVPSQSKPVRDNTASDTLA